MNIYTVRDNLKNTIAGKENMLSTIYIDCKPGTHAIAKMLEVNIGELRRILQDVEQCVKKDVEQSWRDNSDRSGGQFTQDEIDNANRW